MNEKEYLALLENLIDNLDESNAAQTILTLDQLAEIKPVRTKWYVARALAMLKSKAYSVEEIYDVLRDKSWALYAYNGAADALKAYLQLVRSYDDPLDAKRIYYLLCCFNQWNGESNEEERKFIEKIGVEINNTYQAFLDGDHSKAVFLKMLNYSYVQQDLVAYPIFSAAYEAIFQDDSCFRPWIKELPNSGELEYRLRQESNHAFIVAVSDFADQTTCKAVAKALTLLNKKVYFIDISIQIEVQHAVQLEETLAITLQNIEEEGLLTTLHPIELIQNGESLGSNIDYVIQHLNQNEFYNDHALLLSSGYLMDELCQTPLLQKQMGRLYNFQTDYYECALTFGWCGDYLSYVSEIYGFSVKEAIMQPAKCKFSIVIPARNSATTLFHTIKTCLEQTYKGSYEIVVSDNSTGGNAEIYSLCKEINDPRIIYRKTPRDLQLCKSFEYAYLQAHGEYIFALGSDDGLLPWALETLDSVTKQYPEEEIIQWERGFYAWPGFNYGQQNQFIIPRAYKKGEYGCYYKSGASYIATVLKESQAMYTLPMMYINSCFKRSYFTTLWEKTGRLWDWACQDIYMGVISACIKPVILNLEYPLSIAGMSSASIGTKSNKGIVTDQEYMQILQETKADHNMGGFCRSYLEREIPLTSTDTWSLYCSLLRAMTIGVLSEQSLDELFDWKQIYKKLASELDVRDVIFDKKIHEMRYTAMRKGEEFLCWFDQEIYYHCLSPRTIDNNRLEEMKQVKSYKKQKMPGGGIVLDASEYMVKNVYDAVKLFERIFHDNTFTI